MSATTHPDKFRKPGQRNYIRVGDLVKCSPPTKGRPFLGRVTRLDAFVNGGLDDVVMSVNVSIVCTCGGKKHPDAGKARAFAPENITRTLVIPLAEED
jgi:hypothetical protein